MKWRRSRREPPDEQLLQAVSEFVDPYHERASIRAGGKIVVQPGKVLENIEFAMERVDTDIDTTVSIEDFASPEELWTVVQSFRMGPTLAVQVVNTAMRIMSARYPAELVRAPLPAQYDLREFQPLPVSNEEHEIAKTVFNRRITGTADLTEDDIAAAMEPLDSKGEMEVFMALFLMFGTKVGAIKQVTGID
jgi:hypothetical protein